MADPEFTIGSVIRITADTSSPKDWKAFCAPVPWVPETIVVFDYTGLIRHHWIDAIEDASESRTFPFALQTTYPKNKRGAIAFRRDTDAIRFILMIA